MIVQGIFEADDRLTTCVVGIDTEWAVVRCGKPSSVFIHYVHPLGAVSCKDLAHYPSQPCIVSVCSKHAEHLYRYVSTCWIVVSKELADILLVMHS